MINQTLLLAGDDSYNLSKSLRFRSSASAYLSRTPASAGNRKTFTWSGWLKLAVSSADLGVISSYSDNNNRSDLRFGNGNSSISFYNIVGGSVTTSLTTTQVFRDPSAWYHIVLSVDTTQATSSNRVKLYVNGNQITAFSTAAYPAQNNDFFFNSNVAQYIGATGYSPVSNYFDGYLTEVNFIDGQALTPSSFGSTNSLTGVWQPAKYTGTYGTNGFYLPFTNTTSTTTLGYDFSGNSNNWTTNNLSLTTGSTYDSMTDVPTLTSATTANYATLNPLNTGGGTYSNGNLQWVSPATDLKSAQSTIALNTASTGKWYWEVTCVSKTGTNYQVMLTSSSTSYNSNPWLQYRSSDGVVTINGSSAGTFSTFTTGDVIGVTFDASNSQVALYKNNTLVTTQTISNTSNTYIYAALGSDSSGGTMTYSINFGQQPFTYTPPTGFVALNTYNLPTSTIVQGAKNFDINLYTGTGATQSITNAQSFQPSFVWLKSRSNATDHVVHDVLRGTAGIARLFPNLTNAESATGDGFLSINSNGFSLDSTGTGGDVNTSGRTYVAWQWAGPSSGTSNTDGSITSTVSVNASAGFSVVTYTGTGSTATIGHGLGVAPSMIIVKRRDAGGSGWSVYFTTLPAGYVLSLQSTNGQANSSGRFTTTLPTSSVFSVGTDSDLNGSGGTYVAYCWAEIAGFSKFGSYTGNGSSDGTFVYTGFRPRFVMWKVTSTTENWTTFDTARDTFNYTRYRLHPSLANAESTGNDSADNIIMDILSNGFKIRNTSTNINGNGQTYIYMAFAENPTKYALGR